MFHSSIEAKKPSTSPEPERKFAKPSEMKRTQIGSPSSNVSNGPTVKVVKPPPPGPPVNDSKPPIHDNNKGPSGSSGGNSSGSSSSRGPKPVTAPKNAKISDLMKRFEKSPGPDQSHSESPSPQHNVISPVHKSTLGPPPKKVEPDKSPVSGRRFNKKESLGDLKKKFEEGSGGSGGYSDRSTSPSSREGSRGTSPDGGKPFLPPKPGGSGNAPTPPWLKNKSSEERPPLPSSNSRPPFGRAPSPKHAAEPPPSGTGRPLPPWKKELPKPAEQQPGHRNSPNMGRRFPPPVAPAPPEPPAESEKIEEEDAKQQSFVYK